MGEMLGIRRSLRTLALAMILVMYLSLAIWRGAWPYLRVLALGHMPTCPLHCLDTTTRYPTADYIVSAGQVPEPTPLFNHA